MKAFQRAVHAVRRVGRYYLHKANLAAFSGLACAVLLLCTDATRSDHAATKLASLVLLANVTFLPLVWQQAIWSIPIGIYILINTFMTTHWMAKAPLAVAVIATVGVIVLSPIPPFPPLAGEYRTIGTLSDVWTHRTAAGTYRRLPVQIWYPSAKTPPPMQDWTILWTPGTGTDCDVTWFRRLMAAYAKILHLPWFMRGVATTHLMEIKVPVVYGAPLSRDAAKWKVLIYSHGLFGYRSTSSFIMLSLAASGYIVVGVDHAGCAIVAQPHEEGLVSPKLFSLFKRYYFWLEPLGSQRGVYESQLDNRHADVIAVAKRFMALATLSDADVTERMRYQPKRRRIAIGGGGCREGSDGARGAASGGTKKEAVVPTPEGAADDTARTAIGTLSLPGSNEKKNAEASVRAEESSVAEDVALIVGGRCDADNIGVFGHSYGGGTAVACVSTHGVQPPPLVATALTSAAQTSLSSGRHRRERRAASVGSSSGLLSPLPLRSPSVTTGGSRGSKQSEDEEPVFKACVALDPWMYPVPARLTVGTDPFDGLPNLSGEAAETILHRLDADEPLRSAARATAAQCTASPTLFLSAEGWHLARWQMPYARVVAARHKFSHLHVMRLATHLNFCDIPLIIAPWILRWTRQVGSADPYFCALAASRLCILFFDAHLKEKKPALTSSEAAATDSTAATAAPMPSPSSAEAGGLRRLASELLIGPAALPPPPAVVTEAVAALTEAFIAQPIAGLSESSLSSDVASAAAAAGSPLEDPQDIDDLSASGVVDVTAATSVECSAEGGVERTGTVNTSLGPSAGATITATSTRVLAASAPVAAAAPPRVRGSSFALLAQMMKRGPVAALSRHGHHGGRRLVTAILDDMAFYQGDPFKEQLQGAQDMAQLLETHVKAAPSFKLETL